MDVIDRLKPVVDNPEEHSAWESNLKTLSTVATAYPLAKDQMHDTGYSQKQIDALCPAKAILIGFVETTDRLRDEIHQWSFVPLPEALEGLKQATRKAHIGLSNTDREIAALRCVEAVRLYAAGHDGRLPKQLADIGEVPIPIDPSTGKALSYVVQEENRGSEHFAARW